MVLFVLTWDLTNGANGVRAICRHDGNPFIAGLDDLRIQRSLEAQASDFRVLVLVVCEIRGDWPALAEMACVRQHAHLRCPCLICKVTKRLMGAYKDYTVDSCPFGLVSLEDIRQEINEHKIAPKLHNMLYETTLEVLL